MMKLIISGSCLAIILSCVAPLGSSGILIQDEHNSSSVEAPVTYLDTVNVGDEVSVFGEKEVVSETEESSEIPGAVQQPEHVEPQVSQQERFRVQISASKGIDALNEEKKSLETKTTMPLFISFEQPYYRLQIGDFSTRDEAESNLPQVKEMGYPDAWIVPAKASGQE